MSHFTKVKTKLFCLETIKKSLKELGYKIAEQRREARGFGNQRAGADLIVDTETGLDIGFIKTEEGYELVADWEYIERRCGLTEQNFLNELKRKYSYHKVLEQVTAAGFQVVEERCEENKVVKLRVRRWT